MKIKSSLIGLRSRSRALCCKYCVIIFTGCVSLQASLSSQSPPGYIPPPSQDEVTPSSATFLPRSSLGNDHGYYGLGTPSSSGRSSPLITTQSESSAHTHNPEASVFPNRHHYSSHFPLFYDQRPVSSDSGSQKYGHYHHHQRSSGSDISQGDRDSELRRMHTAPRLTSSLSSPFKTESDAAGSAQQSPGRLQRHHSTPCGPSSQTWKASDHPKRQLREIGGTDSALGSSQSESDPESVEEVMEVGDASTPSTIQPHSGCSSGLTSETIPASLDQLCSQFSSDHPQHHLFLEVCSHTQSTVLVVRAAVLIVLSVFCFCK